MSPRVRRRMPALVAAITAVLILASLVIGAMLSPRAAFSPERPGQFEFAKSFFVPGADAGSCTDGSLVYSYYYVSGSASPGYPCKGPWHVYVLHQEWCSGRTYESVGASESVCLADPALGCPSGWWSSWNTCAWHGPTGGVLCESSCKEKKKCPAPEPSVAPPPCVGEGTCCPNAKPPQPCALDPVRLADGSNFHKEDVFPLGGGGFPPSFQLVFSGQHSIRSPILGGTVGEHWSDSLEPYYSVIYEIPQKIRVRAIDGAVVPFTWSGTAWSPDDGRTESFVVNTAGGYAQFTDVNQSVYTFSRFNMGAAVAEGSAQRVDRPNGDYMVFMTDGNGYVASVSNRLGETVRFTRASPQNGRVVSVTAPSGDVFDLAYTNTWSTGVGEVSTVTRHATGSALFTFKYPNFGYLSEVDDGNGNRAVSWTFDATNSWQVATETGPGASGANSIAIATPTPGQRSVTLYGADLVQRTDYFYTSSPFGSDGPERLDSWTMNVACPGCPGATGSATYWPGTNNARAQQDANGFWTVNEDLSNPGVFSAAYDSQQNALVVYDGCESATTCNNGRRRSYAYVSGTAEWSSSTHPSVKGLGTTVTDSREFDGASMRLAKDHRQGFTASALGGALDAGVTNRTTSYTYGGGSGLVDVTQIDGPYDGIGNPPVDNSEPLTTYAYYGSSDADLCSGLVAAANTNHLKSVTRMVDGARSLTTQYCSYDGAGHAQKLKNPDGTVTQFTFDYEGRITQTIANVGGLALTTDFVWDAAGHLIEVLLPRTTASGRTGYYYLYNDPNGVSDIKHGYLSGATFTSLETAHFAYNPWGDRTEVDLQDGAGITVISAGAKYDAFHKLAELAMPAGSATFKTSFAYDAGHHLKSVADAQSDTVFYGSQADVAKYDRFGNISRVRQQICDHPASNYNGTCSGPATADVDFAYDPAAQLSQVAVKTTAGTALTTTSYTTDDFGSVVKVVSPDSGTSSYTYDPQGRLFQTQDGRGKTFQYAYDRMSRVTTKTNITGTATVEVRYCYDGYDAACGYSDSARAQGRLTSVQDKAGKVTYSYDNAGRLTSEARTFPSGAAFTTSYQYDANGNVTQITHPDGVDITYSYDEADRASQVKAAGGTITVFNNVAWYPFAGLKAWGQDASFTRNAFSITRDAGGRITATTLTSAGTPSQTISTTYAYANDGNVSAIPQAAATPDITHDSLSRITQDRATGGTIAYSYDAAGNRLSAGSSSYTYAANSDRLTSDGTTSYTYDAAGNVVQRGGAMITVADDGTVTAISSTFVRDYKNLRRTSSGAEGGTYFYDSAGDMLEWDGQCSASAPWTIPHEDYVYLGGRRVAAVISATTYSGAGCTGTASFAISDTYDFYSDKMDVPRDVLSTSRNVIVWSGDFDGFGNPVGTINQDPDGDGKSYAVSFRLPGQFALAAADGGPTTTAGGLAENWRRVYDSGIGRYLEADSEGLRGSATSYAYAENVPLRILDRNGSVAVIDDVAEAAAAFGVAAAGACLLTHCWTWLPPLLPTPPPPTLPPSVPANPLPYMPPPFSPEGPLPELPPFFPEEPAIPQCRADGGGADVIPLNPPWAVPLPPDFPPPPPPPSCQQIAGQAHAACMAAPQTVPDMCEKIADRAYRMCVRLRGGKP